MLFIPLVWESLFTTWQPTFEMCNYFSYKMSEDSYHTVSFTINCGIILWEPIKLVVIKELVPTVKEILYWMHHQVLQGHVGKDDDDEGDDDDFETEFHGTYSLRIFYSQNDLELLIFLFLSPGCWYYRCLQPCPVHVVLGTEPWDPWLPRTQQLIRVIFNRPLADCCEIFYEICWFASEKWRLAQLGSMYFFIL